MVILSLHGACQNSSAALFDEYELVAAIQQERLTRRKGDGGFPWAAAARVLAIAGCASGDVDLLVLNRDLFQSSYGRDDDGEMAEKILPTGEGAGRADPLDRLRADLGVRPGTPVFFYAHHLAHALSALFYTDWDDALIYTTDGGGSGRHCSHRMLTGGRLTGLGAGNPESPPVSGSLGLLYAMATEALGYRAGRHEGKLTGLAGFGEPLAAEGLIAHFSVDACGEILGDFTDGEAMRREIVNLAAGMRPADLAASVQLTLEEILARSVENLLAGKPRRYLCLAGGVFANVRLNRRLARDVDEIFIFPAMGNEGLAIGGGLQFLMERDGSGRWLARRRRLTHMSWGEGFDAAIDRRLSSQPGLERLDGNPAEMAARALSAGLAGAIYDGRMEFGPRALGNRSILAAANDASINQRLNERLNRSDFMPFAPAVLREDARSVFDIDDRNDYACRFMTITTTVKPAWRGRIPAVVHVDGTARPQIVDPALQPLFADILIRSRAISGLPVLVNTSFNAHEEPIINTPEDCLTALADDRIDFVVTGQAVYRRRLSG